MQPRDWFTVFLVAHAQDDLRGPVVPRHHVGRHHKASASSSRQPKVQDLQRTVGFHHNIARFQILKGKYGSRLEDDTSFC